MLIKPFKSIIKEKLRICTVCSSSFTVNAETLRLRKENANLFRYITAYRQYGHLKANINPLSPNERFVITV